MSGRRLPEGLTGLAVVVCCACTPVTAPRVDSPLVPPAHYEALYEAAQACSGLPGDYGLIVWRVMPGHRWKHATHGWIRGLWRKPHHIWLAFHELDDDWLVTHESLHDLSQSGVHGALFGWCNR